MRISDWSSDVCSSDLVDFSLSASWVKSLDLIKSLADALLALFNPERDTSALAGEVAACVEDRKSEGSGKGVSVRVDFGGLRNSIQKNNKKQHRSYRKQSD